MGYLIGISLDDRGGTGSDSRYVSLAIFLVFSVRFFFMILKLIEFKLIIYSKKKKSFKYLNLKNRTTFRFCLIMSLFSFIYSTKIHILFVLRLIFIIGLYLFLW